MLQFLKRIVIGTFLEQPLRGVHKSLHALLPSSADQVLGDRNLRYDEQTSKVMRMVLKEDSNCIDVGCHRGSILKEMVRAAPGGRHLAFEPIPDLFLDLEKTFEGMENVRIYPFALSDASGQSTFQYVVSNPGYSGLVRRKFDRPNETVVEIAVKTEILDRIIPEGMPVHFIKVDVEGGELQVFQGAVETIRRNSPVIVFEHGLGAADCYGTGPEQMFELLTGICRLRVFILEEWLASAGERCMSREDFIEEFQTGRNFYFLAAP